MAASVLHPRSGRPADHLDRFPSGSENRGKRGRKKTVSWPSDEKLCEVRQFMTEDIPSLMGLNWLGGKSLCLETSQRKRPRLEAMNTGVLQGSRYSIAAHPEINPNMDECMSPSIRWRYPQKFILDTTWLTAGGDESTEASVESKREMKVLEAFYPRVASIPDSPVEPHECCITGNNTHVPLIPLEEAEIDDEEDVVKETFEVESSVNATRNHDSASLGDTGGSVANGEKADCTLLADPNIAAVASAACMAVKVLGESNLVDQALLVKLLKNPSLLKSLISINHTPKYNGHNQFPFAKSPIMDHDSHSNDGSPESVLTNWGEDVLKHEPPRTHLSATNGISYVMRHASPTSSTANVTAPTCRNAPSHLVPAWRLSQQEGTQVQNSLPIASNLEASSLGQDGRIRISPSMHLMQAVISPMQSHSVLRNEPPSLGKLVSGRRVVEDNKVNGLQRKSAHLTKADARSKRPCIYFNTHPGCRRGGSCAFLHQSLKAQIDDIVQ